MTTPPLLQPKQVKETVEDEQNLKLPVQPLHFISVRDYTTFDAEVAIAEGDLIYHFFANKEINALSNPQRYWLELFPKELEKVAQEYFKATFPRLKAAYTEEQASWWMRAYQFGMVLDPHRLAYGLFDALDAALDTVMKSST